MKIKMCDIAMGILVCIILVCSMGTIKSDAVEVERHDNPYAVSLEEEYKEMIQDALSQEGIYYSGITMTKIFTQSGEVTYKVKIHNQKLEQLSEQQRESLLQQLQEIKVSTELDNQRKEFLILNL